LAAYLPPMRIFVHDFAGHPFQVQLSRELARRGHTVRHAYCASLTTTPQATLEASPGDPASFSVRPISLGEPLQKGSLVTRWRQERRYGRLAAAEVEAFRPEVVLSANTPLDAQGALAQASRRVGARDVLWVQDLLGVASARLLRARIPVLGRIVGAYYERMEAGQLRSADALILITEDFRGAVPAIATHPEAHVIPNWAPLDALPPRPRGNAWAEEQGLGERVRFVYSGTLGMKHNPALLAALARALPEADVVVISQGAGADWLRTHAPGLSNLRLLPFQPFDRLPEVLGAADVLVAVLEPDAGVFSVPSKVLTQLCAGRPQLLAVPLENLAARIVAEAEAGLVVAPDEDRGFVEAAARLAADPALRQQQGERDRAYAERTFDLTAIADRFEAILRA
jgi:colanic acid biosynthesis glycosyl transferase WcaI